MLTVVGCPSNKMHALADLHGDFERRGRRRRSSRDRRARRASIRGRRRRRTSSEVLAVEGERPWWLARQAVGDGEWAPGNTDCVIVTATCPPAAQLTSLAVAETRVAVTPSRAASSPSRSATGGDARAEHRAHPSRDFKSTAHGKTRRRCQTTAPSRDAALKGLRPIDRPPRRGERARVVGDFCAAAPDRRARCRIEAPKRRITAKAPRKLVRATWASQRADWSRSSRMAFLGGEHAVQAGRVGPDRTTGDIGKWRGPTQTSSTRRRPSRSCSTAGSRTYLTKFCAETALTCTMQYRRRSSPRSTSWRRWW